MSKRAWAHVADVMENLAHLSADWLDELEHALPNSGATEIISGHLIPWAKEAEREYYRERSRQDFVDYYEFIYNFGARKYHELRVKEGLDPA